ncbi:uncharacterized protein [Haliotis asinina]|uniref:uncharacterized protein n=1 Tax=Haliotis asinina TaxID=109174 RepID=UPI0035318CF1
MDEEDDPSHHSELSEEPSFYPNSETSSCTSISNPHYDGPYQLQDREVSSRELENENNCTEINTDDHDHGRKSKPEPKYRVKTPTSPPKSKRKNEVVMVIFDFSYLLTCAGILRVLQVILSLMTLVCLVTSGGYEGGLLNLPLSWHFRIMIFVLILTLLFSFLSILANITSLVFVFPFEWTFIDLILYSVFAFLYLVGTSLVASAFDFYIKMQTNVSQETIHQLVVCVVFGYICMAFYGITALCSYRTWKVQYRLYQRRRLLEEDEIDI